MWSEGITPINVLHEYVSPTFIKQLRRVYGLLNSLRQYIPQYSNLSQPK